MEVSHGCLICGDELCYSDLHAVSCHYCGKQAESQVSCKQGHYVCDTCHTEEPLLFLEQYVASTSGTDPVKMLTEIMDHPSYHMHGPEHHYLVPAVILTALKNLGYEVPHDYWQLVLARCSQLPGGTCGYWGACSAALGNGIAASILRHSNPLKKEDYGEIHSITADALAAISRVGGPRCCKRNTMLSVQSMLHMLNKIYGIELPASEYSCTFTAHNDECIGKRCPFIKKK